MAKRNPCGISKSTFVATADKLWETAQTLFWARRPSQEDPIREPLQLLVGALIYHRRALLGLDNTTLHEQTRYPTTDHLARTLELTPADFGAAFDNSFMAATMHLASAAFRLPVAIYQANRLNPTTPTDFSPTLSNPEENFWIASAVQGHLPKPACCRQALTPLSALSVVMLVRQDFAHGEEAESSKRTRTRSEKLTQMARCRLVLAEQRLIEWALNKL
jgi:hypothetical protein